MTPGSDELVLADLQFDRLLVHHQGIFRGNVLEDLGCLDVAIPDVAVLTLEMIASNLGRTDETVCCQFPWIEARTSQPKDESQTISRFTSASGGKKRLTILRNFVLVSRKFESFASILCQIEGGTIKQKHTCEKDSGALCSCGRGSERVRGGHVGGLLTSYLDVRSKKAQAFKCFSPSATCRAA